MQVERVTGAIGYLMVVRCNLRDLFKAGDPGQDLIRLVAMGVYHMTLVRVQRARFVEDLIGDT